MHGFVAIAAAVMLFAALGDWPYGYYQLLRLVICGAAGYLAFLAHAWGRSRAVWLFGIVAVLFNPFVPVHLPRELWQPIDLICGVLFLIEGVRLKPVSGGSG